MALNWLDISLLMLLVSLAGVLAANVLTYLSVRDAREMRRNRQAACRPHDWARRASGDLVCRRCGKSPGEARARGAEA
jgi:hypothetical protein